MPDLCAVSFSIVITTLSVQIVYAVHSAVIHSLLPLPHGVQLQSRKTLHECIHRIILLNINSCIRNPVGQVLHLHIPNPNFIVVLSTDQTLFTCVFVIYNYLCFSFTVCSGRSTSQCPRFIPSILLLPRSQQPKPFQIFDPKDSDNTLRNPTSSLYSFQDSFVRPNLHICFYIARHPATLPSMLF